MKDSMGIYAFGRKLLRTNDLDPVYVVLQEANLEPPKLRRWLLAYWCFYHCGTASFISSDKRTFWLRMRAAAESKTFPRCNERRHFRGDLSIKSVDWLENKGLSTLFMPLQRDQGLDSVMEYVTGWYGFGDWIAFKVADMVERLDIACIEFPLDSMFLFDSPRKGASTMFLRHGDPRGICPLDTGRWAVERLLERLGERLAPPRYERRVNGQEVETILCKWRQHVKGRYKIGQDIEEVRKSLKRFPKCTTSKRLLTAGKEAGLWQEAG
jgi:hypothetical protein